MTASTDCHCLGAALVAVACLVGVSILGGIALSRVFGSAGRRVGARRRVVVVSRGLAPVEVEKAT